MFSGEEGLSLLRHYSLSSFTTPRDDRHCFPVLRVLYFSEATFISTLGHIYFQDLETGSLHLGVAGEKHGEDLMENKNNRLE